MSAEDNPYPAWIAAPAHLVVKARGKAAYVFDYEYHTDRSGKTWILVQNGAQEQKVLSTATLPRVQIKTTEKQ